MDQEDEGRTLRTVGILNAAEAYRQTLRAIESHRPEAVSKSHWNIWKMIRNAMKEEDSDGA